MRSKVANRNTHVTAAQRTPSGGEVMVSRQDTEIDTPVLPSPEVIERINSCRPDLIDWMVRETSLEAAERRERARHLDREACIGFRRGQWFGLIIGLAGIIGGSLVAILSNSPATGGTIATSAIVVLAVAFLTGKRK